MVPVPGIPAIDKVGGAEKQVYSALQDTLLCSPTLGMLLMDICGFFACSIKPEHRAGWK